MVRKCAAFAFGLALVVALAVTIANAHAVKVHGPCPDFSAPCEPLSLVFEAAGKLKPVSTIGDTFTAGHAASPADVV